MLQIKVYKALQEELLLYGFEIEIAAINKADWGRWDCSHGVTIVVTELGALLVKRDYFDDPDILDAINQVSPKGQGEFVSPALQEMLSQF